VRHSGSAITQASARVIESNRSGHACAPEDSAPWASLESTPRSNICRVPAFVLEAKILKVRSLCAALSTGLRMNPMIVALWKSVRPIRTPHLAIPASLH
jgi:hypothetical protein